MFEKYITIKESKIIAKQTSSGIWYCSELPADNVRDLDVLIGQINKVLNKYNKEGAKKPTTSAPLSPSNKNDKSSVRIA